MLHIIFHGRRIFGLSYLVTMHYENTIQGFELKCNISSNECIWQKHRPVNTEKTAENLLEASEHMVDKTKHTDLYIYNS